ncbi:nicotinate-nucleotide adenylyltransferase [Chloroflexota bacterium]
MARIGIFGGTFDPPHIGHLILAAEACLQINLDQVLWVLTPFPPHKSDRKIAPLSDRLDMLQAALADNPEFEISRVDLDRPPPLYAVESVRLLKESYPGWELAYLMGGDSLSTLPNWHNPRQFIQVCDLIGVMCRPDQNVDMDSLEMILPGVKEKVQFIEAPLLEIASSQLRNRIAQGRPFRYYLPAPIYAIIKERNLYQSA